ncbi:MAG TPA: MFS transporter [Patescibacteria group bacterium]|nr:MFS transporter [Patescibacteria group bacterium]
MNYGLLVATLSHTLTHIFEGIHTSIFSLLREEFSLSLQQLGLIAAIPPLCQSILSIPTGILADRYGSKRMLLLSAVVGTVGALLASQASGPVAFIVAVSLVYINTTIYHPASYSFTTKMFAPRDRPKALGLHGAGGTLGHASGPLAVSILIGVLAFKWRQVYLLLTLPMVAGIVMILFLKDEPVEDVEEAEESTSNGDQGMRSLFTANLVSFLGFSGLRMIGVSMINTFIVLYLQDVRHLSLAFASFISSGTMLTGFISAPLGGVMASRFGEKRWLVSAQALSYICLALSLAVPDITWFAVLFITYGFCNTLSMAARNSMMATLSPSSQRGLGFALLFLPGSIMGAVAPVLAGYMAAAFGFNSIFYAALLIYVVGLAVLVFAVKVKDS